MQNNKFYVMKLFSFSKRNADKHWIPQQQIYLKNSGIVSNPTYIRPSFEAIFDLINTVPEMGALIQYVCNNVSKIPIKLYDRKGQEVLYSDFIEILETKLFNLTFKEMIKQVAEGIITTGNAYLNIEWLGNYINKIYFLNPIYVKIITQYTDDLGNYNKGRFDFRTDVPEYFAFITNQIAFKIDAKDILQFRDVGINTPLMHLYGKSRLIAGIRAITSLSAAYDIKVTAYQKRGAMVIISPQQPNDLASSLTVLDISEKESLAKDFHSLYGFGDDKSPYIITNRAITAKEVPFNLQNLQINELSESDFRTLCRVVGGISPNSLGDTKGSTYNNVKTYRKENYENVFIPLHELIIEKLNHYFEKYLKGLKLKGYYDDINAMQEDEQLKADTYTKWNTYYSVLYNNGLITKNDWLRGLGEKERTEKEFNELKTKQNDTV